MADPVESFVKNSGIPLWPEQDPVHLTLDAYRVPAAKIVNGMAKDGSDDRYAALERSVESDDMHKQSSYQFRTM
jgi:hypothetical protein